mmetsp:Transcript_11758/g.42969  ORF Transcript_11758/g.42969 Transcript_11758/m.42969 type:complete len:96 (+) Transcript_11758:356-643(+)
MSCPALQSRRVMHNTLSTTLPIHVQMQTLQVGLHLLFARVYTNNTSFAVGHDHAEKGEQQERDRDHEGLDTRGLLALLLTSEERARKLLYLQFGR